jgi:hypothetical protein
MQLSAEMTASEQHTMSSALDKLWLPGRCLSLTSISPQLEALQYIRNLFFFFTVTARRFSHEKAITLHNSSFYQVPGRLANFKLFVQRYDNYA